MSVQSNQNCTFIMNIIEVDLLLFCGNFLAHFTLFCGHEVDKLSALGGSTLVLFRPY